MDSELLPYLDRAVMLIEGGYADGDPVELAKKIYAKELENDARRTEDDPDV